MYGADPRAKHPLPEFPQICFIANTVTHPHIEIGDYTYYDDPEDSENFERNVRYHFDFVGDKLIIGKFCALKGDTVVGNDVWIGHEATILPGVHAGRLSPRSPWLPAM